MKKAKNLLLTATAAFALLFGTSLTGCGGDDPDDGGGNTPSNRLENPDITGKSLAEALDLIKKDTAASREYSITLTGNESALPQSLEYLGRTVKITLKGGGTVSLSGTGTLFTVGSKVTLTLGAIALEGKKSNSSSLVEVGRDGTLIMNAGSAIRGNTTRSEGGGVFVAAGGIFTMNDGTISGNEANNVEGSGGGVCVTGVFTMNGGTISGNNADFGGGVYVYNGGAITMTGGVISNNVAVYGGGGVLADGADPDLNIRAVGTFTMTGGTINSNRVSGQDEYAGEGGGVCVYGAFTLSGGSIRGNNAEYGGGVFVYEEGVFTKTTAGGVIYGNVSTTDANTAGEDECGYAVFACLFDGNKYRDTTVTASEALAVKADGTTTGTWQEWSE